MHVKSTKYPVMDGEPHLGSQTEHELVAKPYEVEDFILQEIIKEHDVREEYVAGIAKDGSSFMVNPADYIDLESVEVYLDSVDEIEEDVLYVYAAIVPRPDR